MSAFTFVSVAEVPKAKRSVYGGSAHILAALIERKESVSPVLAMPTPKGLSAGRSLARRLTWIAEKEGYRLEWSRSKDAQTFYFWITPKDAP